MAIHPIRNDQEHAKAMLQIKRLWGAKSGTAAADKLEIWVALVEAYEAKKHSIAPPDPIDRPSRTSANTTRSR